MGLPELPLPSNDTNYCVLIHPPPGLLGSLLYVCIHKHAKLGGSAWGHAPQEIFFGISRCSEIVFRIHSLVVHDITNGVHSCKQTHFEFKRMIRIGSELEAKGGG